MVLRLRFWVDEQTSELGFWWPCGGHRRTGGLQPQPCHRRLQLKDGRSGCKCGSMIAAAVTTARLCLAHPAAWAAAIMQHTAACSSKQR